MATNDQPEQGNRSGPTGWEALCTVLCALLLVTCLWPGPRRYYEVEEALLKRTIWAAGMALALGVTIASIRRGPARGRWAAYLALAICLVSIGIVIVQLAEVSLRRE